MLGITIVRDGDLYTATAEASGNGGATSYSTDSPLSVSELINALRAHGWHQQDIGDAFYEADPGWLTR
jgi:hypothetical protein